jgi:hypothetical protein
MAIFIFVVSFVVLIGAIVYLLNKRYPIAGAFEVSNLFGRIIMVSILVAAAFMAFQHMSD